jgi:hypothetical protein
VGLPATSEFSFLCKLPWPALIGAKPGHFIPSLPKAKAATKNTKNTKFENIVFFVFFVAALTKADFALRPGA